MARSASDGGGIITASAMARSASDGGGIITGASAMARSASDGGGIITASAMARSASDGGGIITASAMAADGRVVAGAGAATAGPASTGATRSRLTAAHRRTRPIAFDGGRLPAHPFAVFRVRMPAGRGVRAAGQPPQGAVLRTCHCKRSHGHATTRLTQETVDARAGCPCRPAQRAAAHDGVEARFQDGGLPGGGGGVVGLGLEVGAQPLLPLPRVPHVALQNIDVVVQLVHVRLQLIALINQALAVGLFLRIGMGRLPGDLRLDRRIGPYQQQDPAGGAGGPPAGGDLARPMLRLVRGLSSTRTRACGAPCSCRRRSCGAAKALRACRLERRRQHLPLLDVGSFVTEFC